MAFTDQTEITPRESTMQAWRVDEFRMQAEHQVRLKELELALQKDEHQATLALKAEELRLATLLRIPVIILRLPLLPFLGVAYICSMFTKKEMPKRFWDLLS